MITKRQAGKYLLGSSILALSKDAHCAFGAQKNNVWEMDVSKYTHAIFPREHGQLIEINRLVTPLARRYPSRDQCMQMTAFFNAKEAIVVIGNDPSAAIVDWMLHPQKILTIKYHGAMTEPLVVQTEPNLPSIAAVYRKWAVNQFWMKPLRAVKQSIDFFSVASMSSFDQEKKHFDQIRKNIDGKIGVWFTQWRRYHFDTMYPDYSAKDREGFFSFIQYLERNNAIAMPYINSMLIDLNNHGFASLSEKVLLRNEFKAAKPYSEKMKYLQYACPGSELWRKILASAQLSSYQGSDAVKHGIYLDMLAAAAPEICWSLDHQHAPGDPCAWQNGLLKLLSEMRGVVMVEGCAEVYLNSVDYCLAYLHTHQSDTIPLWNHVYGDLGKVVGWSLDNNVTKLKFKSELLRIRDFGIKSRYGSPWMVGVPESKLFIELKD